MSRRLTLTCLAALIAASGCVKTHSGRRALILIPSSQEMSLGEQAFKELGAKEKRCRNAQANAILADIGRRIAAVSPHPEWKWEFHLFDAAKTANAFALPGGKVGVYTGLYGPAANAAGLAAVIGHEVAHAVQRHGAERMSRTLIMDAGMKAAQVSLGNSAAHDRIMGALGVGAKFGVMLPYSRKMELEADRMGLIYMAKAGYDPSQAIAFWQRFAKASGGAPPELLSTHPATAKRIATLKAALPAARKAYAKSSRLGLGMALRVPNCAASTMGAPSPSPSPSPAPAPAASAAPAKRAGPSSPAPAKTGPSRAGRKRPGR